MAHPPIADIRPWQARRLTGVHPLERQRRFAEGEAVEVAGEDAFHAIELFGHAGVDAAFERFGVGYHRHHCLVREIGATGVAREDDRAAICVEIDFQIVGPMFGQLLKVLAAACGRHLSGRADGHFIPFLIQRRAGAGNDPEAPAQQLQTCHRP